MNLVALVVALLSFPAFAKPHWDPSRVHVSTEVSRAERLARLSTPATQRISLAELSSQGQPALRVHVEWVAASESYRLQALESENSATPALIKRAKLRDPLGSFKATLRDPATGAVVSHDALGTGTIFRRLVRTLTFRFPMPDRALELVVEAEHPTTGRMEEVLRAPINPAHATPAPTLPNLDVRRIGSASTTDALRVVFYADGYTTDDSSRFWIAVNRSIETFKSARLPGFNQMEFWGVYARSGRGLGRPSNLGMPVQEFDSFTGLYFPYWEPFGRWVDVVYPTSGIKLRRALGQVPYDYPVVINHSRDYWGVGNYKQVTAVPSDAPQFSYLLLHELGHFFGLNEEYDGGGRTELEFAPGIAEPWSQNITWLRSRSLADLKWASFVSASTPLPTHRTHWRGTGPYGAYAGGYADSDREHGVPSHIPGLGCIMDNGPGFCPVCQDAILKVVQRDLGQ